MSSAGTTFTDVAVLGPEAARGGNHARGQVATSGRATVAVFTLSSLLGSTLLFLVQPIIGRLLLPAAGGTASLWNTAMVFFQGVLLVGYLVAHFAITKLGVARQRFLHVALLCLPLLFLPLAVPDGWSLAGRNPVGGTLTVLVAMVGVPFLALATSSPTLQRWFAATDHPSADNPYFLYAAGNIGSLAALLTYPLIIERHLGLSAQTKLFTGGYVAFLVCTIAAAFAVPSTRSALARQPALAAPPISWTRRSRWVLWSGIPSALLLGTTRYITTDIASFPLLWILPLVLYLATFIVAFAVADPQRVAAVAGRAVVIGAIPVALTFLGRVPILLALGLHLAWMFAAALLAHARLAADRPAATRLTEFYAWLSVGGVIGGAFVALAAPVVFDRLWEYPLAVVAALTIVPTVTTAWRRPALIAAIVLLVAAGAWLHHDTQIQLATIAMGAAGLLVVRQRTAVLAMTLGAIMAVGVGVSGANVIAQDRSFFGTYAVIETDDGGRLLQMGTTIHGAQRPDAAGRPSTYYHPSGPLGSVFGGPRDALDAALIGLGAGEIAAYGQVGDDFIFYEIDQLVVDIARRARVLHVPARQRVRRSRWSSVTAESNSSEAMRSTTSWSWMRSAPTPSRSTCSHVRRLPPTWSTPAQRTASCCSTSPIATSISPPVVDRIGRSLGVAVRVLPYTPDADAVGTGAVPSTWVAVARSASTIDALDPRWSSVDGNGPLWTDDYSNVLAVLGG